jgi:hypothetical protein
MDSGVINKVREYARQTSFVAANHHRFHVGRNTHLGFWHAAHRDGLPNELVRNKRFFH